MFLFWKKQRIEFGATTATGKVGWGKDVIAKQAKERASQIIN